VPFAARTLLWRALALREVGVVRYAWLTIAPAMLTLLALLPVVFAGWREGLAWVLLAAALLSALFSWSLVRRACIECRPVVPTAACRGRGARSGPSAPRPVARTCWPR
jgi:hypothetical protein